MKTKWGIFSETKKKVNFIKDFVGTYKEIYRTFYLIFEVIYNFWDFLPNFLTYPQRDVNVIRKGHLALPD